MMMGYGIILCEMMTSEKDLGGGGTFVTTRDHHPSLIN
jgi:hypothetical protein